MKSRIIYFGIFLLIVIPCLYYVTNSNWCDFDDEPSSKITAKNLFYEMNLDHKVQMEIGSSDNLKFNFELKKINKTGSSYFAEYFVRVDEYQNVLKVLSFPSGCLGQVSFADFQ